MLSFPTPSLPCLSNKESTCWGRSPTVSVHKVPRSKWCNIVSSNLHWQRTVLIAWPPERLLITWILPPKGKWLQRLNLLPAVFRDAVTWSCRLSWLVFNMYNNARKWCWVPLRSPEHWTEHLLPGLFTQSCIVRSIIPDAVKRKAVSFIFFFLPVVFNLPL